MHDENKLFNGLDGLEIFYKGETLPPEALAETKTKWMEYIGSDKYKPEEILEIYGHGTWADGTPIKVGVGDTGLGQKHLAKGGDLEGSELRNFTGDRNAYDFNSHGSHVSCMIGSKKGNTNGGITGLAKDCKIYHAKVLSNAGSGSSLGIRRGLEWLKSKNVKVVSLSLGGGGYSAASDKLYRELDAAGIIVLAAAGNSGKGGERSDYPARYSTVLSVAAIDFSNKSAPFSSESAFLDISAPGVGIYSCSWNGYTGMSGTSMATPMAAAQCVNHIGYFDRLGIKVKNAAHYMELIKPAILDLSTKGKDRWYGHGVLVETKLIEHYGIPGEKPEEPPVEKPPVEQPPVEKCPEPLFRWGNYGFVKYDDQALNIDEVEALRIFAEHLKSIK